MILITKAAKSKSKKQFHLGVSIGFLLATVMLLKVGIRYDFRFMRASLVAQLVKNPPTMQETWVRSLGWEDPLEKGKSTHSSILACRIPWTVHGDRKELDTIEQLSLSFIKKK